MRAFFDTPGPSYYRPFKDMRPGVAVVAWIDALEQLERQHHVWALEQEAKRHA